MRTRQKHLESLLKDLEDEMEVIMNKFLDPGETQLNYEQAVLLSEFIGLQNDMVNTMMEIEWDNRKNIADI
jgi:hypothetical protein